MTQQTMQLNDITTYDADKRIAAHPQSGVMITWPETPAGAQGQLSTIFRLVYELQVLEFRTHWQVKQTGAADTLICQPYIDDGIERTPAENPLHNLIEPVYACLWRYVNHVSLDKKRLFALAYGDGIYTGGVRQTIARPQS